VFRTLMSEHRNAPPDACPEGEKEGLRALSQLLQGEALGGVLYPIPSPQ